MINKEPDCCEPLGELKPGPDVTIFYQLPWSEEGQFSPSEADQTPFDEFVIRPFDDQVRWTRIVNVLNAYTSGVGLKNYDQLIHMLETIDTTLSHCAFNILKEVIASMRNHEKQQFYDITLPFIISSTLKLPTVFNQPIPVLKQQVNHSFHFHQQQLTSLLAAGFLGTFPVPTNPLLSHFTCRELFHGTSAIQRKAEKLKCLLNYFMRAALKPLKGTVTFRRRYVDPETLPDWTKSSAELTKMVVSSRGTIEDDGEGMLEVDFAHKLIGGKTLSYGMVQEEVRFIISPELIVSMLFTEEMLDTEAVVITGTERFNSYSGYSDTFKYSGDFIDLRVRDEWGRRYTKVVAIDASYFHTDTVTMQYYEKAVERETVKAYVGFMEEDNVKPESRCAVATGNWGCGVYNGDPQLKALMQWIAASLNKRDLVYFTFNDRRLTELEEHITQIERLRLNTKQLYNYLIEYGKYIAIQPASSTSIKSLFATLNLEYDRLARDDSP